MRTPAIMMTDIYRVIIFTDHTLTQVFKISDNFLEDGEGAYKYAKEWKYSAVVKIQSIFNEGKEEE